MKVLLLSDSYSKQEESLFLSDCNIIKAEWNIRLPQIPLNFVPVFNANAKYNCVQGNSIEGASCNETKVAQAIKGMQYDMVAVIAKALTSGGAASIAVCGFKYHDAQHSGSIFLHEIGHLFGFGHDGRGIMTGGANDGATIYTMSYSPSQIETIKKRVGVTTDNTTPQIAITGTYPLTANLTPDILYCHVFLDGTQKYELVNWARNTECNGKQLKVFMTIPNGQHEIKIIGTSVDNKVEASVIVTV